MSSWIYTIFYATYHATVHSATELKDKMYSQFRDVKASYNITSLKAVIDLTNYNKQVSVLTSVVFMAT